VFLHIFVLVAAAEVVRPFLQPGTGTLRGEFWRRT
jgi:hypothetical protein